MRQKMLDPFRGENPYIVLAWNCDLTSYLPPILCARLCSSTGCIYVVLCGGGILQNVAVNEQNPVILFSLLLT